MTTKISCAFYTLLLLSPCFTTSRKSAPIDLTLSRRRMAFLTGPLVDNSRAARKISNYENLVSGSSKMPSCCDASILSTRRLNRILNRIPVTSGSTRLFSLKPAALPLMDSGKALARSGELLIDLTTTLSLYGGSLSATGACIRNCGDCLAQAAASCRFKTAVELVIDELREGADCLKEGGDKLGSAVKESEVVGDAVLMNKIQNMIGPIKNAALHLEETGASILRKESVNEVGQQLILCGGALEALAVAVGELDPASAEGQLSSQRMVYASQQMILAGKELRGEKKEAGKGKSWIKG